MKAVRLSPNEEAAVIQKRQAERRKARIIQVREQDRGFAYKLRQEINDRKEAERRALQERLRDNYANAHHEKLKDLEAHYLARMEDLGMAHREAQIIEQEDIKLNNQRALLEAEKNWRAGLRSKVAIKELSTGPLRKKRCQEKLLEIKKRTREMENRRASRVAHMSVPTRRPLILDVAVSSSKNKRNDQHLRNNHRVQFKEAKDYGCSYYHIPQVVWKDTLQHSDSADKVAEQKDKADKLLSKQAAVLKMEQDEKARIRHIHALAKVKLEKDKVDMLSQLSAMEREDRTRRQKAIAKMPSNLFQPVHKRIEMASEQQRDMEQAFEKILIEKPSMYSVEAADSDHLDQAKPMVYGEDVEDFADTAHVQSKAVHFSRTQDSTGQETTPTKVTPGELVTLSSSSEDITVGTTPSMMQQPLPASPPVYPLASRGSSLMDYDATGSLSITPLPYPTEDMQPTIAAEDHSVSPSKGTQTQHSEYRLSRVLTRVLSQPDLSVTDTVSLRSGSKVTNDATLASQVEYKKSSATQMAAGMKGSQGIPEIRIPQQVTSEMPRGHLSEMPRAPQVTSEVTPPKVPMAPQVMSEIPRPPQVMSKVSRDPQLTSEIPRGPQVESDMLRAPQVMSETASAPQVMSGMPKSSHVVSEVPRSISEKAKGFQVTVSGRGIKKVPDEAMQKLILLVKAQQEERKAAQARASSPTERKSALLDVQGSDLGDLNQAALSISALSTRDSSPSLEGDDIYSSKQPAQYTLYSTSAPLDKYPYHGEAQDATPPAQDATPLRSQPPLTTTTQYGQFLPSRSLTYSPAPLSVSQYHTSLETSAFSLAALPQATGPFTVQSSMNTAPEPLANASGSVTPEPSICTPQLQGYSETDANNDTSLDISQLHTLPSHHFPTLNQQMLFGTRVDYSGLNARRDLSMSPTVTMHDVSPDLSDRQQTPTEQNITPGSEDHHFLSPSLAVKDSRVADTPSTSSPLYGHTPGDLLPPSLDVTSSGMATPSPHVHVHGEGRTQDILSETPLPSKSVTHSNSGSISHPLHSFKKSEFAVSKQVLASSGKYKGANFVPKSCSPLRGWSTDELEGTGAKLQASLDMAKTHSELFPKKQHSVTSPSQLHQRSPVLHPQSPRLSPQSQSRPQSPMLHSQSPMPRSHPQSPKPQSTHQRALSFQSPQFLPLTETSFTGDVPTPLIYTPLKALASSPTTDTVSLQNFEVPDTSLATNFHLGSTEDQSATPPDQGTYPPYQGATPPDQGTYPPYQGATPPDQGTYPPYQGATPPYQGTYPPYQGATPYPSTTYQGTTPYQDATTGTSPAFKGTTPPYQDTTPPYKGTTPPYQDTNPPYKGTTPPYQDTSPCQGASSPYQDTTPPYKGTTPPYQGTSPYQDTTPPYKGTTPPYQDTSPCQGASSPYQGTSPYQGASPHQGTSPPYQDTTPYQDASPHQGATSPYQSTYEGTASPYQSPYQTSPNYTVPSTQAGLIHTPQSSPPSTPLDIGHTPTCSEAGPSHWKATPAESIKRNVSQSQSGSLDTLLADDPQATGRQVYTSSQMPVWSETQRSKGSLLEEISTPSCTNAPKDSKEKVDSDSGYVRMSAMSSQYESTQQSYKGLMSPITKEKVPPVMPQAYSLQDALLKKRLDFVKKSQERMENLVANALKRQQCGGGPITGKTRPTKKGHSPLVSKTPMTTKGAPGIGAGGKYVPKKSDPTPKNETQSHFNSNVGVRGPVSKAKVPVQTLLPPAKQNEKIRKKEMKERNLRFYNRLPEVKTKREEEQRSKEYAENRKKAKMYQQQIQSKRKPLKSESMQPMFSDECDYKPPFK